MHTNKKKEKLLYTRVEISCILFTQFITINNEYEMLISDLLKNKKKLDFVEQSFADNKYSELVLA